MEPDSSDRNESRCRSSLAYGMVCRGGAGAGVDEADSGELGSCKAVAEAEAEAEAKAEAAADAVADGATLFMACKMATIVPV